MSYEDFQRYIDNNFDAGQRVNFKDTILPKIKQLIKESIEATFLRLDRNRRLNTFELFGYDIMIDTDWKPWIIECNTNPCLALSSSHLSRLIPALIENTFKLTIDIMFPGPETCNGKRKFSVQNDVLPDNKYELIFHSLMDGKALLDKLGDKVSTLVQDDPSLTEMSSEEELESEESEYDDNY